MVGNAQVVVEQNVSFVVGTEVYVTVKGIIKHINIAENVLSKQHTSKRVYHYSFVFVTLTKPYDWLAATLKMICNQRHLYDFLCA